MEASEATEGLVKIWRINKEIEENEHSLEMHLPFIQKLFIDEGRGDDLKIVPLMVGEIMSQNYRDYAEILTPLFLDKRTVFIISSDFCRWDFKLPVIPDNQDD